MRVHSKEAFESVQKVSELLFNNRASKETLFQLGQNELATVAEEIPSFAIKRDTLAGGVNIVDLMSELTPI
ncbi:MAG: tyrosine--tRNA ligase, partial [Saprospiraceae bacterium]